MLSHTPIDESNKAFINKRNEEIELAWKHYHAIINTSPQTTRRECLIIKWEEQEGKCAYCEEEITLPQKGYNDPSVTLATCDHILPLCLEGEDRLDNIAAACADCNTIKGDIHPDIWLAWVTQAIKPREAYLTRKYLLSKAKDLRLRLQYPCNKDKYNNEEFTSFI